jgi:two-component system, chemotaxis family, sensor kinase CheA
MAGHPVFADDMREIVESFLVETREIFDRLDNDLLRLEQTPDDHALVDEIFRAVHTVKGTSGFLSLEQLNQLTHHFEEVLNLLRKGKLDFQPAMMDVMLAAFDQMKALVEQVVNGHLVEVDLGPIIAQLESVSSGTISDESSVPAAVTTEEANDVADDLDSRDEPDSQDEPSAPAASAGKRRDLASETIRVDVGRLDNLLNLVGELVLGRNRLSQIVSDIDFAAPDERHQRELEETRSQIDFITTELQSAIMHTRMVQIGRVFNKFPRVMRDLAKEFGKQINLEIEGEETELDKSLIEEIGDPLVHLIRNAADHGIELPSERAAQGKPEAGTVRLAAAHEGNHIVITISDDGAGMNPEVLKQKGIERGIMTAREAAEMSDAEAFQLIFRAGFSTAKTVSKVSGRGVGMDVVKTNITRLNGTISIQSAPGEGSTFVLRLPLTLAIIQSLLVRVEDESFAIPLHSVVEVVSLAKHPVTTINAREVIRLREQVLPLIRTADALSVRPGDDSREERKNVVVVAIGHNRLGFVVDDLIGQKEIVIKPLGSYLKKVPGVAGSTILGDGRVIMILDIGELLRMHTDDVRGKAARRTAESTA